MFEECQIKKAEHAASETHREIDKQFVGREQHETQFERIDTELCVDEESSRDSVSGGQGPATISTVDLSQSPSQRSTGQQPPRQEIGKQKMPHIDVLGKSDAKNWITQGIETVLKRYKEIGATTSSSVEVNQPQNDFDVEAYIETLEKEEFIKRYPALENTHLEYLPAGAERGTTSSDRKQESETGDYQSSGLTEQQRRLIDINRQVALHRKARDGNDDQAKEM